MQQPTEMSSPSQPPPAQLNMQFLPPPPMPSAAAARTSTCCTCGVPIAPNAAKTCARCIRSRVVDITAGMPRHAAVVRCPSCSSYLHPPRLWLRAAPESPELMRLLLRRVDRHIARLGGAVALAAAEFVSTEPHSKRLALRLRLRGEVLLHGGNGGVVTLEQGHVVEFAVHDRDVRSGGGLDFYFASRSHAARVVDLVTSLSPARVATSKQLVSLSHSHDSFQYTFAVELCPVCRDDLVFLPKEARRDLGGLGPIVLCIKVTNALSLLDIATLRVVHLGIREYDRYRFEPVLTSRQLVEYVVLDVDHEPVIDGDVAYAQVARVSYFGKNDTIFTVRTHLGNLLNSGDRALGYDLYGVNVNNDDVDSYGQRHGLPDAVLVKKSTRRVVIASCRTSAAAAGRATAMRSDRSPWGSGAFI